MLRQEKTAAVESLQKLFEDYPAFFVTDYKGLNVADLTVLRKNLRENKIKYLVAKNTLLKLAAHGAGQKELDEHFVGPTAVAFTSEDPSTAARILYDSYKDKDLPVIKAFVVEDTVFEASDIRRLASLPSRDILLSQLVAAVESPLTSVVGALDGVFRELVGTVEALAERETA
jgi:large subunit ribosomal protein L10